MTNVKNVDVSAMLSKVITSDDEREERGCERNVVEFRQRWCLCVCLYVCLCMSVCVSLFMSVCVSLCMSVCICVSVYVCVSVCLCVCLYVCASVVVSHSWDRMTQAIQVASSSDALFHSSDSQL